MALGEEESGDVPISEVEKYTNMALGEEESGDVPISEVEKYTNMTLGEEESLLFGEVSLFWGCPYREVLLYSCTSPSIN